MFRWCNGKMIRVYPCMRELGWLGGIGGISGCPLGHAWQPREIRAADDIGCWPCEGVLRPSFNSHQARGLEILPADECGVVVCRDSLIKAVSKQASQPASRNDEGLDFLDEPACISSPGRDMIQGARNYSRSHPHH